MWPASLYRFESMVLALTLKKHLEDLVIVKVFVETGERENKP